MIKLSKSDYDNLNRMVSIASTDSNCELEAVIKTTKGKPFSRTDFENLYKRCISMGMVSSEDTEVLDIRYKDERNKVSFNRISIKTINAIKEYCKNNNLNSVHKNNIIFIKKNRYLSKEKTKKGFIEPLQNNDYNFRVNLNHESNSLENDKKKMLDDEFKRKDKFFRLKKRYSFKSLDNLFRFDLTIIKSSSRNISTGEYIYTRDLKYSNTLLNPENYEFELEFIGHNKLENEKKEDKASLILNSLITNVGVILQVIKDTYYIMSNDDQKKILHEYWKLVKGKSHKISQNYPKFIGPKNVSISKKNMCECTDEDSQLNIRKNYCVTEKADGERYLLFISKSKKVYLINNRLDVKYTGKIASGYSDSLLDGELILKNNLDNHIFKFLIFDIYYSSGQDIRNIPFKTNIQGDKKSRVGHIDEILKKITLKDDNEIDILSEDSNSVSELEEGQFPEFLSFELQRKQFYYGNIDSVGSDIFKKSAILLDKISSGSFNYETDGLIFTPVNLGVGSYIENDTPEFTGITWDACFKWKPPSDNTIDFLVEILKEKNSKGNYVDKITYKIDDTIPGQNTLKKYKTLILKTGFNPKKHGKINPCLIFTKEMDIMKKSNIYISKEFVPDNNYDDTNTPYLANIELQTDNKGNNRMLCYKTGDEIEDNTIIEMSYDINKPPGFRWLPRNVRYDKTQSLRLGSTQYGNDFTTANNIWNSLHDPIDEIMIKSGKNINYNKDNDVYYSRAGKRDSSLSKNLLDFHNLYVKFKLITTTANEAGEDSRLLDLACGKGGDLPKWIQSNFSFVLGIDISKDNIENPNDGACLRYYKKKEEFGKKGESEKLPEIIFSVGNSSKRINNGDCTENEDYKKLLKVIFNDESIQNGDLKQDGLAKLKGKATQPFDVCSIQFALHYFFKDLNTLRGVMENISINTKVGGYFIGTCFDGETMFNKLKNINRGQTIQGMVDGKPIWRIEKDYDNKELKNNSESLGMSIWVYMETINKKFEEYLVNFTYFKDIIKEYGFELIDNSITENYGIKPTGLFSDLFDEMIKDKGNYKLASQMTEKEKEISFCNRYFIFKKIENVDIEKLNINKEPKINEPKTILKIKKKKKIINKE
jgi:SAM-dependent methyltransferase